MVFALGALNLACDAPDKPSFIDYPKDANDPNGPLKFYAAFDGTSTNTLMNAVDSIRANFPSSNPLKQVDGISGKAIEGISDATTKVAERAINYPSANGFSSATSFTVAFWIKRPVNNRTEFLFSLKDDSIEGSNSSLFMMAEHASDTSATVKVGVMGQWLEFPDANKLKRPLFDGKWHHWVITYDESSSKLGYYFDGSIVANAPESATKVANKVDFSKSTNLVIGGWNKHAGLSGTDDDWVGNFTGNIDQFRMYNKVLTAQEILSLFTNKR